MNFQIQEILDGTVPENIKDALDHCEHIIGDCEETLRDPEVQEHDKAQYRKLKRMAVTAKAMLNKHVILSATKDQP